MIFPSEKKKELWRYASRNNPPAICDIDGINMMTTPPPQPPRPPHQRRPPPPPQLIPPPPQDLSMTPPPPYSSLPCALDCASCCRPQPPSPAAEQQQLPMELELPMDLDFIKAGCSCASSADENAERCRRATSTSTFAMTAANMFRNCCGGGSDSTMSSRRSSRQLQPNPSSHSALTTRLAMPHPLTQDRLNQDFNALMKQLKHKQIAELLRAVKSRIDPGSVAASIASASPSFLQCILIKCTSPAEEEQHLTACRLFFWSDLRNAAELRRLPVCPNARDYVYVCCNPLHWSRVIQPIDAESAPPPYQRSKMLRVRDADSEENSQNIEKSASAWATTQSISRSSISSIIKRTESELYAPHLESFTTDGEGRTVCSKVWCQIAYWELAQRVGEFFHGKKPAINIYTDGPVDCVGDSMCLRDLVAKRAAASSEAVQNTRQKIGLGVTLSMDCDDVWIYNRGNVPIFVDSPTLSERLDRVCKVMPGYCLKAFDTHRAQLLACRQSHGHQLGPIDRYSMKISFAKGWGPTYRRQDIMGCPCWLEVHFSQLR